MQEDKRVVILKSWAKEHKVYNVTFKLGFKCKGMSSDILGM